MAFYILSFFISLVGSTLTFFSGFGLGTLLLPLFLIYFEPTLAIPAAAIVHFSNSIVKFFFVFKHIHVQVLLKFGIPAVIAAYIGSKTLSLIQLDFVLGMYQIGGVFFLITPLKVMIGILIIAFAGIESSKRIKSYQFSKNYYVVGGTLSGFFGGLSGHQGALRSLFLKSTDLSKEQLIATSTSISLGIDLVRIIGYVQAISLASILHTPKSNILYITLAGSIIGVIVGNQLLKKVSLSFVHKTISIFLLLFGIALILGLI